MVAAAHLQGESARVKARALAALLPALLVAAPAGAAAVASGRNWQIAIGSLACEGASVLVVGMKASYLGAKGLVEAPISQLVDAKGQRHSPRGLVWKSGSRDNARWLSSGGVADLRSGEVGDFQLKFDVQSASGELKLEFGDIAAFPLTRKDGMSCESLLRPDRIQPPRKPRTSLGGPARGRVYRSAYACLQPKGGLRTVESLFPPYAARQLLLLGRGYLPNARFINLPSGHTPAQPYAYSGADDLKPVEEAALRALAADFPEYAKGLGTKYFAYNWGLQDAASGNKLYSIGIYEIRPCPG